MKEGDFKIWAKVDDQEFDNNDNRYFKIQMTLQSDSGESREIQVVECQNENPNRNGYDQIAKSWCPEFTNEQILSSNINKNDKSWLRLSIEYCDVG